MNLRAVRILLWCIAGMAGGAAVLVVTAATIIPTDAPAQAVHLSAGASAGPGKSELGPADLAAVMDVELRRPFVDRPAPRPAPQVENSTEVIIPTFHLSGTIVEPGHSLALFTNAAGKTEFKRVGDQTQGAEVLSIRQDGATIQWNGRQIVLSVDRPAVAAQSPVQQGNDRR